MRVIARSSWRASAAISPRRLGGPVVHAIYRFAALVRYAIERRRPPQIELTEG